MTDLKNHSEMLVGIYEIYKRCKKVTEECKKRKTRENVKAHAQAAMHSL